MKISEMMLRDVRAEIEYGEEIIVVRNAKGEVRKKLLDFFKSELDNSNEIEKLHDEIEILEMLMKELTNIELDSENLEVIFMNPSDELQRVIFYLMTIMQELMFETLAMRNLETRFNENTILEKDTLKGLNRIIEMVKEMEQRTYLRVDNLDLEEDNFEPKTNVITDSVTKDEEVVQLHGDVNGKNIQ